MRILILGGYGTFGGRLAQLLADTPELTLLIAGRSSTKATDFCRAMQAKATLIPCAFDRNGDVQAQVATLHPDLVVDATGPFQDYGNEPYRVVKACLALAIHYMDLADGSAFVDAIRQFDAQAKTRGIYILSGVSSFPVLTAAVVRVLAKDMRQVRSITGGIAPSPYAGVGLNVIRAISSYAGKKVPLTRGGKKTFGYGLTETMRYTISPPGRLPLHNLHFSLVDVPDLQVIPEAWPQLESIWMGAGPVPAILHRVLNGLAWLARLRIVPSLLPLAGIFYRAINIVRWGEHRGGMFVSVRGVGPDGVDTERSWHLLAEGNDGPFIPSMAIEAIVRRVLADNSPAVGARPAMHDLELADYDALFQRRTIYNGFRNVTPLASDAPLYRRVLQDAWYQLPEILQSIHTLREHKTVQGTATVERGSSMLARIIAFCIGFPKAGEQVPVTVDFSVRNGGEIWRRNFAGKSFYSTQYEGTERYQGLLCERFGPCTFGLALVIAGNKLQLIVRRWSILGIPMPACLAPAGDSYEVVQDGRFHFHVEIRHPLTGLIVRYRGSLVEAV